MLSPSSPAGDAPKDFGALAPHLLRRRHIRDPRIFSWTTSCWIAAVELATIVAVSSFVCFAMRSFLTAPREYSHRRRLRPPLSPASLTARCAPPTSSLGASSFMHAASRPPLHPPPSFRLRPEPAPLRPLLRAPAAGAAASCGCAPSPPEASAGAFASAPEGSAAKERRGDLVRPSSTTAASSCFGGVDVAPPAAACCSGAAPPGIAATGRATTWLWLPGLRSAPERAHSGGA